MQPHVGQVLNRANFHRWARRHRHRPVAHSVFMRFFWTLIWLRVRINYETNNVRDLTAPLSMNGTLSRMT